MANTAKPTMDYLPGTTISVHGSDANAKLMDNGSQMEFSHTTVNNSVETSIQAITNMKA